MANNDEAFYNTNLTGKAPWSWVAYVNGKEVANEPDYQSTVSKARQLYPDQIPTLAPVIPKDAALFV